MSTAPTLQVGQSAHRSRRVTDRDIKLFTEISGDRNPLHYDAEFAARTRFGDVITGEVVVTSARADKPITGLDVRVVRDDGVVAVEGTAVCYTATPTDPG